MPPPVPPQPGAPAPSWEWTAKLPLFLLGLVALLLAAFTFCWGKSRAATLAGVALLSFGVGLLIFSYNLPRWCQPADTAWSSMAWGHGSFNKPPTLRDCLWLTRMARP